MKISSIVFSSSYHLKFSMFFSLSPVTKRTVIPLVPLPVTTSNSDRIFFKNHPVSSDPSHYFVQSPLNLVDDDQSSIIIFKEDINN